jgi:hypothetical protein
MSDFQKIFSGPVLTAEEIEEQQLVALVDDELAVSFQ